MANVHEKPPAATTTIKRLSGIVFDNLNSLEARLAPKIIDLVSGMPSVLEHKVGVDFGCAWGDSCVVWQDSVNLFSLVRDAGHPTKAVQGLLIDHVVRRGLWKEFFKALNEIGMQKTVESMFGEVVISREAIDGPQSG